MAIPHRTAGKRQRCCRNRSIGDVGVLLSSFQLLLQGLLQNFSRRLSRASSQLGEATAEMRSRT
jgi:hypothetical protein